MTSVKCTVGDTTYTGATWADVKAQVDTASATGGGEGGDAGAQHEGVQHEGAQHAGGRRRRHRTRKHGSRRHHGRRHKRRSRRYGKGSKSKTRHGDMDFTTKRGNKDFHRRHHDVKKSRRPFRKRRRSRKARGAYSFF